MHLVLGGVFCSFPESCALDVHAHIIAVGIPQAQVYGVFSPAASEFDYQRLLLLEHLGHPMPLYGMGIQPEHPVPDRQHFE